MEMVSRPHTKNLLRFAKTRPEVVVLSADLTASCEAGEFRDTYPDRFFSLGLAEQNMMGFAAGLAREKYLPHVHTFAVFICRRPFDQVAMSIGYPNLKVRLVGFLPGITTPGGVTHQAIDDVGLMRLIPNMTVIDCGDATDVESALDVMDGVDGPVYVRMLRGEVPRLFDSQDKMRLGRVRELSFGSDLLVISSGICTEEALRARGALSENGVSITHLHVSTLKPFDPAPILAAAEQVRHGVITIENHSVIGGLGSLVAESMAEAGLPRKLRRLGVQDRYAHGASRPYLMRTLGLDAAALIDAAADLLKTPLDIDKEKLSEVQVPTAPSDAKAEDL
jgi:transketolase